MMTIFVAVASIIAVISAYLAGYCRGKANRKFDLAGVPAEVAFAFYQKKERERHLEDIRHIDRDLRRLKSRGIVPPDLPLDVWINVQKGPREDTK